MSGPAVEPEVWTLREGATEIARLIVTDENFPWLFARVEATQALDDLRPLFARQLDGDPADIQAASRAIRERLTLRFPNGDQVPGFLLHVEGDKAWWRFWEEPSRDEPPGT